MNKFTLSCFLGLFLSGCQGSTRANRKRRMQGSLQWTDGTAAQTPDGFMYSPYVAYDDRTNTIFLIPASSGEIWTFDVDLALSDTSVDPITKGLPYESDFVPMAGGAYRSTYFPTDVNPLAFQWNFIGKVNPINQNQETSYVITSFDMSNNEVAVVGTLPNGLGWETSGCMVGSPDGSEIWMIGGYDSHHGEWGASRKTLIFDIEKSTVRVGPQLNLARDRPACANDGNNKLYVFGGYAGSPTSERTSYETDTIEMLDLDNINQGWQTLYSTLSEPRQMMTTATIGGRIFISGGYQLDSFTTAWSSVETVDIFDVSTSGVTQGPDTIQLSSDTNDDGYVFFVGAPNVDKLFAFSFDGGVTSPEDAFAWQVMDLSE